MSEQTGVSFLDPSSGFLDDVDVTIVSLRAGVIKKQDGSKEWPGIIAKLLTESNREVEERYFAGTLERLRPSPDGLRILPNVEGAKISDQQPAYKLILSIINAVRGMDDKAAAEAFLAKVQAAPDSLAHYDGLKVHVNRIPDGKPKEGSDRPSTVTLVSRIIALPGAAAAKGSKPAAKPAAKTQTTAAAPAAAASAPAAGAVDDAVIAGLLVEALREAGGTLERNKVATAVYQKAKAAGLDWKAVMTRANQDSFLEAVASEPVVVNGEAVMVEYAKGKAVTLVG